MSLIFHKGDVLDAPADAVIVPIAGEERHKSGNISHQALRRWGEDWQEVLDATGALVPLGRAAIVSDCEPLPFRHVLFISVLDHLEQPDPAHLKSALIHALGFANWIRVRSIASPLPTGGWRFSAATALKIVVEAVAQFEQQHLDANFTLTVWVRDRAVWQEVQQFGRTLAVDIGDG